MREHKSISIADQIFEQLEHDILAGKYERGESLSELRLSAELGVSRTPIREAIRRLEQEGILEESGRGVIVVGITHEDMMDMYEIRMQVEGMAARRAAERVTAAEIREMRNLIDLQRFYAAKEETEGYMQVRNLDSQFHVMLYRCSGSKVYYDVLSSLHKKISKYRMVSVSRHDRAQESIDEHEAICDALAAHDGDRAFEAAERHMKNARESMAGIDL